MKNRSYIEKMSEIHASEDLIQKTIKSVNDMNKLKNGMKFKKILAGAASVITLSVGSVGAYMAITGNSILSILGLGKASINYEEKSVAISEKYNTIIENNYARIQLEKIAADDAFLILEYDIKIKDDALEIVNNKDSNFIAEDNYDYSQIGNSVNLGLSEQIQLNEKNMDLYTCYAEKVEDSENEYKFYDIVNLMEVDKDEIDVSIAVLSLKYQGYQFMMTDTNNNYLLDLTLRQEAINTNAISYNESNVKLDIKNIVNTNFATYLAVGLEISDLTSSDYKNYMEFLSTNSAGDNLEYQVYLTKYLINTENDMSYDILRDFDDDEKTMDEIVTDKYLLNNKNIQKSNKIINFEENFSNGTAIMEFIILYPNELSEDGIIKLVANRNGKEVFNNIEIKVDHENDVNLDVNNISLVSYTDIDAAKFKNESARNEGNEDSIKNEYYNENAQKIEIQNYEVCGLRLGIGEAEALDNLQKYYNNNKININCDNYYNKQLKSYQDMYMGLSFENGKLKMINIFNYAELNVNKLKVGDIISKYYSEEILPKYNQNIILYGKDDYIASGNGEFNEKMEFGRAYIDSADRITFLAYEDSEYFLYFNVDPSSKLITNIWYGKK